MWWQHGPFMWGPDWWIFPIVGLIVCVIIVILIFRFMIVRGSLRKEILELRNEIQNLKRKISDRKE
jgi:uncharacterized membrane-anchored protein YhcB (DUF1043 family)